MKKIALILFFTMSFVTFNGCEDDTSLQSCIYRLEYGSDKSTTDTAYQAVIDLADGECKSVLENAGMSDELKTYKAAAYLGLAGISLSNMVDTLLGGGDLMNELMNMVSGGTSALYATEAVNLYDEITNSEADCNSTTVKADACTITGYVRPLQAVGGISTLTGDSLTYNGEEVSSLTAVLDPTSVGINSGTATEFDVDGDGLLDSAEASAIALSGAVGSFNATYDDPDPINATLTFTKDSTNYTYDHNKVTINSIDNGTYANAVFYKLLDQSTSVPILTDGYCSTSFVTCTTVNTTDCFVCPVISSNGTSLSSTTVVVDALNSADASSPLYAIKTMISNGTITEADIASYLSSM